MVYSIIIKKSAAKKFLFMSLFGYSLWLTKQQNDVKKKK